MTKNIELLAPAGTWEALEAAVNAGADAVYLGGSAFGARQYAENFGPEELKRGVKFAHLHNVLIYVTVNTLVDDSEMSSLGEYLVFLSNIGVDGIIVQDMGVINLARKVVPNLPLHASTQMTVTNSKGVEFTYGLGMPRAVLARETTLDDLKTICKATPSEIEVFIHGALCVCYSGQCLMSSLIGGRSGNRGRCAQPCRLPYTLVDKEGNNMLENVDAGQYLLSPKDLNTLDILPELIEAGVVSFKIEGRMKRPEYVAVVVDIYRRAIDSYLNGSYHVPEEDKLNIEQIFNRDFTTAYLEKRPGRTMMSDRRPNNRGVLIGRVASLNKENNKAVIKLEKEIHVGDGLEFWVSVGGRVGTELDSMLLQGKSVTTAGVGDQVEIDVPKGIRLNDRVFRTFDNKLMTFAKQFYGNDNKLRLGVKATVKAHLGEPMEIVLEDAAGNVGVGRTEFIVEVARKHALDEGSIKKQLDRLGTTEFALEELMLEIDPGVMVPISEINEARRKAVESLEEKILAKFNRPQVKWHSDVLKAQYNHTMVKHSQLVVEVDTVNKAKAAYAAGADWVLVATEAYTMPLVLPEDYEEISQLAKTYGKKWGVVTPRIVSEKQLPYFTRMLEVWKKAQADLLVVGNNGLFLQAKKTELPLWVDFSLNQYNTQSLDFWKDEGVLGATLSPELTMAQVEKLLTTSPLQLECLVDGPIEMMVSEYCVPGSFLGNLGEGKCTFACKKESFLKDRKGEYFPLKHDPFGRMHVLNGHNLSMITSVKQMEKMGLQKMRIDGRSYDELTLQKTVAMYRQVLDGQKVVEENLPHTTRGHYFRGVL